MSQATTSPYITLQPTSHRWRIGTAAMLLLGVLLPAVTVVVEVASSFCAEHFFNPIPSWLHVGLVSIVPIANLLAVAGTDLAVRFPRAMGLLNGVAIAVAAYFTVVFAPLSPLALFAILALGLGLLPLSPVFSLITAVRARKHLRHAAGEGKLRGLFIGLLLGGIGVFIADGRIALTHWGLHLADAPETRSVGLQLLRVVGNETDLVRACYNPNYASKYAIGVLLPAGPSVQSARATYYRLTGQSFNAVDRPGNEQFGRDRGDFDNGLGGAAVAGRVTDLSLDESRIDGTVDGDAAWAYLEWTMVFRNDHPWDNREARFQLATPPGGVASRVTLWVNGQPCEAAFGGASEVRRAYQQVAVVQRRDPLLVTSIGPDRLLVQCFPILPKNTMKIRVGMTVPLAVAKADTATLQLPTIVEQNFTVPKPLMTAVYLDGPTAMKNDILAGLKRGDGRHELHGKLVVPMYDTVSVARNPAVTAVVTREAVNGQAATVVQRLTPRSATTPAHVVAVVDLSAGMAPRLGDVAAALKALPAETKLTILAAGDEVSVIENRFQLPYLTCSGGVDASAALAQALDDLATQSSAAVLWFHGQQPEIFDGGADAVLQRLHRRGRDVPIHPIQVAPGPNRLIEQLNGHVQPRVAMDKQQMEAAVDALWGGGVLTATRERVESAPADLPAASSHIARLWAADRVRELIRTPHAEHRKQVVELATGYQLVTPVTGAVVLETAAQYVANNLQPANPASTPSVPEPGSLAVVALAGYALLARRRRSPALGVGPGRCDRH